MKDLIEREVVLKEIQKVCFSKECTEFRVDNGSYGQRDYIIDFIKQMPSVTPSRQVIEDIKNDIRHIVDEETEHDKKWARGLHYSLCIIDKHTQCNESEGMRMEELLYKKDVLELVKDDAYFVNEINNLITFPIEEILKRMWDCRGKETTNIDKVKMEMIIKDVLKEYSPNETKE